MVDLAHNLMMGDDKGYGTVCLNEVSGGVIRL